VSRGLANHRLYLAQLMLSAWGRDRAAQSVPAVTLDQAFAPGVREHLIAAYGHFLNHVLDPTGSVTADPVPRCCDELPQQLAGKALPGEIREFRQLEQEGWLAQLLAPLPTPGPRAAQRRPSPGALVVSSAADWPVPEQVDAWCQRLQSIFQRMDDSLDEC
jgi:hypothetical protein